MDAVAFRRGQKELKLAGLVFDETQSPDLAAPLLTQALDSWLSAAGPRAELEELCAELRQIAGDAQPPAQSLDFSSALASARALIPALREATQWDGAVEDWAPPAGGKAIHGWATLAALLAGLALIVAACIILQ